MTQSALDQLVATEAIRQLKSRYCRFVDTKQWARLAEVFAPDAQLEGFGSVPDGSDPAAFVAGVSERLAHAVTIHHVHNFEILFREPARARGIWAMMDYVDFRGEEQQTVAAVNRGWIGWGYYEDEYACTDGRWRISYMRLVRQRMDELTAAHPCAAPGRHKPSVDWI